LRPDLRAADEAAAEIAKTSVPQTVAKSQTIDRVPKVAELYRTLTEIMRAPA